MHWLDERSSEAVRFGLNGLAATIIHFGVLTFEIETLHIPSAGLANFIAAVCGIAASFTGNRYFVFKSRDKAIVTQAAQFVGLYAAIACVHAATLLVLTDWLGIDFRLGFVVATCIQVTLSYLGSRRFVFAQ